MVRQSDPRQIPIRRSLPREYVSSVSVRASPRAGRPFDLTPDVENDLRVEIETVLVVSATTLSVIRDAPEAKADEIRSLGAPCSQRKTDETYSLTRGYDTEPETRRFDGKTN
jgi:hypothetical protein